jgi:hypothetical protein
MNSTIYKFCDFTHNEYEELLILAKKNFKFCNYKSIDNFNRSIVWRHDVDFSMHEAYNLAIIEHRHGISATYFLMMHSEYYNLFEKEISDLVKKILSLGHEIGLHFDSHYYGIFNEADLEKYLLFEKNLISHYFNKDIDVFSFHNTTDFTMSCIEWEYAGLINTYAKRFQSEFDYCSDSNGFWRFNRLKDVLAVKEGRSLQVLTHPEWWTHKVMSPKEKIDRCILGRTKKNQKLYAETLIKFQRENIDW